MLLAAAGSHGSINAAAAVVTPSATRLLVEYGSLARARPGNSLLLSPSASQHLLALRALRPGTHITIFDSVSGEWLARVASSTRRGSATSVELLHAASPQLDITCSYATTAGVPWHGGAPVPVGPWLLHAQLSDPKRERWLVEKATEMGAGALWRVITARSQREPRRFSGGGDAYRQDDDGMHSIERDIIGSNSAFGHPCLASLASLGRIEGIVTPRRRDTVAAWVVAAVEQSGRMSLPLVIPGPPPTLDAVVRAWMRGDGNAGHNASGMAPLLPSPRLLLVMDECATASRGTGIRHGDRGVTLSLSEWLRTVHVTGIGEDEDGARITMRRQPLVGVIVGPEGGWSRDERELLASAAAATTHDAALVLTSLPIGGGRVLRTETAAVVALALVQSALEVAGHTLR